MKPLKAGVLYFAVVFGSGFVLGTIRTLWVVPRLGTRTAELLEAPIMVLISFFAAQWVIRLLAVSYAVANRFVMGFVALALMLAAEFSLVFWVRGQTIRDYITTRDPVSGTAYYVALGLFALMPLFVERTSV